MRLIGNSLWLAAGAWLIANLPLLVMFVGHWPKYDRTFFSLLGMYPGQFLFLFIFFPFIAFWTFITKHDLLNYISRSTKEIGRPAHPLWRHIVERQWGIASIGIVCGVALASADLAATSRGLDQLSPNYARLGIAAASIILQAVERSNSTTLVERLNERGENYPDIDVGLKELNSIVGENLALTERNKRIVEAASTNILQNFRDVPRVAYEYGTKTNSLLAENKEEYLLDALIYLQVIIDEKLNPSTGYFSIALKVTNFLELVTVIYVAAHVACLSWIMIYMRIKVFKEKTLPRNVVRASVSLIWVTVLFGLWPALRIYTINETKIIFPSATTLDAPAFVYVFCFVSIIFLIGAFLRDQWLQVGSFVLALTVSVITFVLSIQNIFLMRQIVGSGASIGNLMMVLVASLAVLLFVGSLLLPDENEL